MTKLLLIRHGESEANRQRVFAGQLDVPLLEQGIEQAKVTAQYIAENYNVTAVYASDLSRARKTGEITAEVCGAPLVTDKNLREIYAGEWQGKCFEDIVEQYNTDYSCWLNDIGNCRCTNGESVAELADRVLDALTRIAEKHNGKTVAIATHATPIRTMQCIWRGFTLDVMKDINWVSNASVTEVDYRDGVWTLEKIGEDAHLKDIRTAFAAGV